MKVLRRGASRMGCGERLNGPGMAHVSRPPERGNAAKRSNSRKAGPKGEQGESSFAKRNPDVGVPFFGTPFLGKQRDEAKRSNSRRLARRVSGANQGVAPVRGATQTFSRRGNG